MLAQEVVKEFGNRVRFVVQDFGASPLAERFGVDKYPAIFVDEALVARPEDFFAWGGPGNGKYIPWKEAESRKKFQADLRRMVQIRLDGGKVLETRTPAGKVAALTLPSVRVTDLDGKEFALAELRGKPLLVEFWATWCPPCRETLSWARKLDPKRVALVAVAVESEPDAVKTMWKKLEPPGRAVIATQALLDAFGGIPAVPTLFLADSNGRVIRVFYGAAPDLHQQIEEELAKLQ